MHTKSRLSRLAGLECKKIIGQCKTAEYHPDCCFDPQRLSDGPHAHAWSAVKLHGEWYLCDVTWAAGRPSGPSTYLSNILGDKINAKHIMVTLLLFPDVVDT